MHKYLVIVESPAKVKTISKFLGANYKVMASQGHVRDLPKSQMGVDIEHDYEPKYITIRGKGDILAALRKEAKKALGCAGKSIWGFSSAGRAPALQAGGHRFESGNLHQEWIEVFGQASEHFNLVLEEIRGLYLEN